MALAIIIEETTDAALLKKMLDAATAHKSRSLNPESDDYNPKKAEELQKDILRLEMRIREL